MIDKSFLTKYHILLSSNWKKKQPVYTNNKIKYIADLERIKRVYLQLQTEIY